MGWCMKNWMGSVVLAGICLTEAGGFAQTAGIDAMPAYAGTWKTQMEHFDTAYSKAGKESSTLRNECWKSGGYYVCDQFVNGESKALIVFTYSDKDKTYTTYPIMPGGNPAAKESW